jgi:hypothetical protein
MNHHVIAAVSECLRHVLWLGLKEDADTAQKIGAEPNIVLSNPAQPVDVNVVRNMSLWLYHVLPNEHLRNAPPVRGRVGGDDTVESYPPLALNLLYLLTPSTGNDLNDQLVLGRCLQIFHDQSILSLTSKEDPGQAEELHVSLAPRTIDELAKVWEAMQQPYRLSVCYEVRVARIDSQRRQPGGRVGERGADFRPLAA